MRNLGKAAAVWAFLFIAGEARGAILEDVVAKVNGRPLMLSEYRKNLRTVLDNYRAGAPQILRDTEAVKEIRDKVLEQMIDDEVLAQRAEEKKIKVHLREVDKGIEEVRERSFRVDPQTRQNRTDKEVEDFLVEELKREGLSEESFRKRIERQLMVRKVVEEEVRANMKNPDDARAKAAFELLKKIGASSTETVAGLVKDMDEAVGQGHIAFAFRLRDLHAERVKVSHILINSPEGSTMVQKNQAREKAEGIRKRLVGGEDFFDVARKESDDAESAVRGGDLGFMLKDWMEESFTEAAFSLPVGEISQPIPTSFGFHLIRVQEKKAREPMNYDKLEVDIKQFLMNLDFQTELLRLVKRLRAKATIEVKLPAE